MNKFGLLGQKLGHSYSPAIHKKFFDYSYGLYEVEPEELESFLESTELSGMNVTIPYKKSVIPYCAELSDTARRMGSVNTLVRRDKGWYGHNTDYEGFAYTLQRSGAEIKGKKALVLGNGGVAPTVRMVLEDMGAGSIVTVCRRGEDNFENIARHSDAQIIVNATPVGMYPNNGESLVDLRQFPKLEAVFDLIYNPARTALLLQAESLGLVWDNGLGMLVAQARGSAELFAGEKLSNEAVSQVEKELSLEMGNIILIGMPGCGKSSIGRILAEKLGRQFYDADAEIVKDSAMSIEDIFAKEGEEGFRVRESHTLARLGKNSACVISTGGGCVTRAENYPLLHQNGRIVWVKRSLDILPTEGRPLMRTNTAARLYEERKDKYAAFADLAIENDGSLSEAAEKIMEALK